MLPASSAQPKMALAKKGGLNLPSWGPTSRIHDDSGGHTQDDMQIQHFYYQRGGPGSRDHGLV